MTKRDILKIRKANLRIDFLATRLRIEKNLTASEKAKLEAEILSLRMDIDGIEDQNFF
jgi:hypothetical protein